MRQHHPLSGRAAARVFRRTPLCSAVLAVIASTAPAATAADLAWTGEQSQNWFDGANWSPAGPPTADDDARIDSIDPNTANVIGAAALVRDLTVGREASGTLQIAGVGGVSSRVGRIGELEGSLGAVVVAGAGSVWSNSQNLFVGIGGTGSLNVINGGQVFSSGVAGIGLQAGSDGNVLISGAGSSWTNTAPSGAVVVGGDGVASLFVVNGGTLDTGAAVIAGGTGEAGALVSGAGSLWTSSGTLTVGSAGTGGLSVLDGAQVVSAGGVVGNLAGSDGEAVIEGAGSSWSMAADLLIGAQGGNGLLRIQDGGAVSSDAGSLGHFAGSGVAAVTGVGSVWNMLGELTVGRAGDGEIDISDGGAVVSSGATLGALVGGTGAATVRGAGSTWDYGGGMVVGGAGTGVLNVSDGAQLLGLAPGNALIGAQAGSRGEVVVDGADWSIGNGALYVGLAGEGSLRIDNGGSVSNGFAAIADAAGSQGEVTVAGGSWWSSAANLVVGGGGAGRLAIEGGSAVSGASFGFVGGAQAGEVSVSGGSSLDLAGDLRLNRGALQVSGGSTVGNDNGWLANVADAEATVEVAGAGSVWSNAGEVRVGNEGRATLAVAGGGVVDSATGSIGRAEGASGAVSVEGAGSAWNSSDLLTVGDGGQGSLAISDGGAVTSRFGFIGFQAGSLGEVAVTGPGSLWTLGEPPLVGNALNIGSAGSGSLHIAAGGSVLNAGQLMIVGVVDGSEGRVSVEGAGSSLLNAGNVWLGLGGSAEMDVGGGGRVENGDAILAFETTADATVTVRGQGSLWRNSGSLTVGLAGRATLSVLDGGRVDNVGGVIAASAGSTGEVLVSGAGSLWTTAAQFAIGGSGSGTLRVADGGSMGSEVAVIGAAADGTGSATVSGSGSRWNIASTLSVGGVGAGSLSVEDGAAVTGNGFIWIGAGAGAQGTATVRGAGSVLAPGGSITVGRQGSGVLTLSEGGAATSGGSVFVGQQAGSTGRVNIGAAAGEDAIAPGTLDAAMLAFGDGEATLTFNHSGQAHAFDVPIVSTGAGQHAIDHLSGSTLLGGDSSGFSGLTTVSGGSMRVDGALGGTLLVETGGTLGGGGTVGSTTVAAGGTLAPGASIGTLTVDGDLVFEAGSIYAVDLDLAGDSDLTVVTGSATLAGGAMAALPLGGIAIETPYTILTAAGGVAGEFDDIVLDSSSVFLAPSLQYLPDSVVFVLLQSASFDSVALTPNQAAAAAGADSLGNGAPVWDALVVLDAERAREAFDMLSGEVHASTIGALVQDSRHLREALLGRLHAIPAADAAGGWVRVFGSRARTSGDGNAARTRASVDGLLLGGDVELGGGWRLGAAAGLDRASHDVRVRGSSADVDTRHLGVYAGRRWGEAALRLGAGHAWHRVEVDRNVAFDGFEDHLRSRYDASTTQVFGEYAHRFETGDLAVEPFASVAWVYTDGRRFTEAGGPAALTGRADRTEATFATLGTRFHTRLGANTGMRSTLHGRLGWQHAFGDVGPRLQAALEGGDGFLVAGVPIARNSAVLDAGFGFVPADGMQLDLSYSGRFGSGVRDNGLRLTFTMAF